MGVIERRTREKEELRNKIIEAATELFVVEGYQSVSMRRIAEKIEYSPSTIYLYFSDKADLVSHICADTFGKLISALDEIIHGEKPDPEKLRRCLRAYVDFGLKYPNHYYVTFCLPEHQWGEVPAEREVVIHRLCDEAFQRLRDGLSASRQDPSFNIGDVEVAAQSVWMMIHGITSLLITIPTHFPWVDRELLIESALDQILRGLKA